MRLNTLLAPMLAVTAAADRVWVDAVRTPDSVSAPRSVWYNDFDSTWRVSFSPGCRVPGVTNIGELCVDWRNRRARFFAFGAKRCMKPAAGGKYHEYAGQASYPFTEWWYEVTCGW
ncbi:hypothetical protein QBC34DRAFT_379880 [Podospora aff. communis PSN243]|uniref:Ecp2 effector protein domain-containing protein n=1 Tax=Podospora aff. communis PSN243 TaxID=3040156 RepID=A0AAV9GP73_9PEZI|nr:hypothetical protein QBC34DRAFT_379880 [Podospora aff. communis PSN243]